MKILVTGGAGFIGSNLIEQLVKNNKYNVTSLDNYFTGSKNNHIDGAKYIVGNTWDADSIFKNHSFDVVFHFGEYSRIAYSFEDIEILNNAMLRGTPVILELVRKWNAKLIYSATSSALGNNGDDSILSPYAWMKTKMVEYIKNYHIWFGINYQIVHFFNVYGPRHITEGKYSTVIGIFERQKKNGEKLSIVKPGTQTRDFVHVADVVNGLLKVMNTCVLHHKWYFNTNQNVSILKLAEAFDCEYELIPERNGERFISTQLKSDTMELLNWKPQHNIFNYIANRVNV